MPACEICICLYCVLFFIGSLKTPKHVWKRVSYWCCPVSCVTKHARTPYTCVILSYAHINVVRNKLSCCFSRFLAFHGNGSKFHVSEFQVDVQVRRSDVPRVKTWPDGSNDTVVLDINWESVENLSPNLRRSHGLAFIHIPKTAGT